MPPEFGSTQGIERILTDIALAIQNGLNARYRIGDIVTSTSSVNPGESVADGGFGFGTWVAFGEGEVLVGKEASGTFSSAGDLVGAETHKHSFISPVGYVSAVPWMFAPSNYNALLNANNEAHSVTISSQTKSVSSTANTANVEVWEVDTTTDSSIQPSRVVYMWERTA